MNDPVQNEIDRLTDQKKQRTPLRKIGDKRVAKTPFRKMAEEFLEKDLGDIKKDIRTSVKRRLKTWLHDLFVNVIDISFQSKGSSSSNYGSNVIRAVDNPSYKTNYSGMSKNSGQSKASARTFSDLRFVERSNAQMLLDTLNEGVESNGSVTVMELYDAIDDPSNIDPRDSNFGWDDLSEAYIRQEDDGLYRLYLPKVKQFK